jgi:hypothetical protein
LQLAATRTHELLLGRALNLLADAMLLAWATSMVWVEIDAGLLAPRNRASEDRLERWRRQGQTCPMRAATARQLLSPKPGLTLK